MNTRLSHDGYDILLDGDNIEQVSSQRGFVSQKIVRKLDVVNGSVIIF